jgi:hypothetical protein
MTRSGQRATSPVARTLLATLILLATSCATLARAEFTTIINSPPDPLATPFDFFLLPSNTQLNLFAGAELHVGWWWPGDVWEPRDNIELNLDGGTIYGTLATGLGGMDHTNVVFNIRSGTVEESIDVTNGNEINVSGGTIGHPYWGGVRLTGGSRASITGGKIVHILDLDGASIATVSGGVIGQGIAVRNGSHLTISGGQLGDDYHYSGGVHVQSGSTATMTGSVMDGFALSGGSTATISGGSVTQYLDVDSNSRVEISGGQFAQMTATNSGRIDLVGGDFRLDGVPIAGLTSPGSQTAVNIPDRGVLTGVFADGTAVILTQQGYNDWLPDGTLNLVSATVPAAVPGVIHAPGAAIPHSLRAGQRLELRDGAVTPANLRAAWGSTIRINGGEIGPRLRAAGAVIDLNDGRLGELAVLTIGSVLNVTGGTVDSNLNAGSGATVNLSGGVVEEQFHALAGSTVNLTGGVVRPSFHVLEGSHVAISGSGFRINGLPVSGLTTPGATRLINVPTGAVLSGTYANGRPFAFANGTSDFLAPGTIALKAAPTPIPGPTIVRVPTDAAPMGLRTGQLLYLSDGGNLGDDFNADWGSVVNIDGGRVGTHFEAVGALVNVTGGALGHYFSALYGSMVNVAGGTFEGYVDIENGAALNFGGGNIAGSLAVLRGGAAQITGGSIESDVFAGQGGVINLTGGRIAGNAYAYANATLNVSGGQVGSEVTVASGSIANLSGGTFGDGFSIYNASRLQITGKDFRIDGALIDVPVDYYSTTPISIPAGSVFSGVFQDGTPFAFSDADVDYASYGDHLEPGSVRVIRDYYPPPASAPLVDYAGFLAPAGVQGGGAVTVHAHQSLGDNFVAGWGSTVTMSGGSIGANFEAVGAQVTIAGGTVGERFDAFTGSTVTIADGEIGWRFTAHKGSVVNILGGEIGEKFLAAEGSVVNVSGGDFNFFGVERAPGSEIHIFGTDFLVDYAPIPGFGPGQTITLDGLVTVEAHLSDGHLFAVRPTNGYDRNSAGLTARTTLTWTMTADFDADHDVDAADLALWRGASTTGNDFLAWQRQLGARAAPVNNPVPEPAAWTLACLSLLALRTRRRLRAH